MGASTSRHVDVLVVGAGISGMRIARITADRYKWNTVLVEKMPEVGGRVTHVRGSTDDAGAFRILEHHHRTLKLVKSLGLKTEPLFDATERDRPLPDADNCVVDAKAVDLNRWQQRAEMCGHHKADFMDASTGYDGASHSQSSSKPKSTPEGVSMVVRGGGMHAIAGRMKKKLDETPLCKILLQHRVDDIVRDDDADGYTVTCMDRDGVVKTFHTPRVVLAVPPFHVRHLSIVRDWAQPLVHSLVGQQRMRIYATLRDAEDILDESKRGKRLITDTMLRQTIIPPAGDRIQVAYASGKFADYWSSMFMHSRQSAINALQVELQKALRLNRKVVLTDVVEKYWSDGITSWKNGMGTRVDPCAIFHLHKTMCPNVVWSGDAVAPSENGWINSTLLSVGLAINTLRGTLRMLPTFPSLKSIPPTLCDGKFVVLQGRVLDVRSWIARHPGGKTPITNHLREDITALWLQYHQHSAFSWAQVLPLQCGWVNHC